MPERSTPIQVVTWNVKRNGAPVLDALRDLAQFDVLTLQEVTLDHRAGLQRVPPKQGFQLLPRQPEPRRWQRLWQPHRRRWPFDNRPEQAALPQREPSLA